LPHRLGERGSLTVCALAALAAITLLSVRLPLWWPPVVVVTVALACCLARPRWAFRIIQAVALGAVALLLVSA
ncbi:hypothetical protein, partial [Stackebrandtia soli]|uniref:hypothetical protein n=1 Tax=Stackebrandtia soli TaxID=1892856 RepID=UPI0039E823A7